MDSPHHLKRAVSPPLGEHIVEIWFQTLRAFVLDTSCGPAPASRADATASNLESGTRPFDQVVGPGIYLWGTSPRFGPQTARTSNANRPTCPYGPRAWSVGDVSPLKHDEQGQQ